MERLVSGDVVIVQFPYSHYMESKRRPALVVQTTTGDDILLMMITSTETSNSIPIQKVDFSLGSLPSLSFAKISRLFTADTNLIKQIRGRITKRKLNKIKLTLSRFILK